VSKDSTSRQSNFELLRILCMLGVLVGHVLLYLYGDQIHSRDWSVVNQGRVFLLNTCAVAVNCFVMISGYFTIQVTRRRIIRYVAICLWYALFVFLFFDGAWQKVVFPVGESDLWFVPCYLALMLVSPLLNAGLSSKGVLELRKAIALLLTVDVYLGYMHQCGGVGVDGYSLFHLMCMYCLGHWIAKEKFNLRYVGLWIIGCFVLMTALHALKMLWHPISVVYSLHYNSPLLILASALVFLWAKSLKIQSRLVNWIAASVFSVYLILSNPAVSAECRRVLSSIQSLSDTPFVVFCLLSVVTVGTFVFCILIDKVRIWFFNHIAWLCQGQS